MNPIAAVNEMGNSARDVVLGTIMDFLTVGEVENEDDLFVDEENAAVNEGEEEYASANEDEEVSGNFHKIVIGSAATLVTNCFFFLVLITEKLIFLIFW
jgi:hypothetical protein